MSQATMTLACEVCQTAVERGARFCPHCGYSMPEHDTSDAPFVGRMVSQHYRIEKRIARGGMGEVYLARHNELKQQVAVKFLHRRFADDEDLAARFFNEARSSCRVKHPLAVSIYDFGRLDDGTLYIVMEFVPGIALGDLIDRDGPLEPGPAVRIAMQACEVLSHAHACGVIHRDVKPDNIMIVEGTGARLAIKMLDFGIAKILDDEMSAGLTQTGMMFGTPEYMAPEQAAGRDLDHRADIYALGLVLYEMLAGEPPFRGNNKLALLQRQIKEAPAPIARSTRHAIPDALAQLIHVCLSKDPNLRPPDMDALLAQLEGIASELKPSGPIKAHAGGATPANRTRTPRPAPSRTPAQAPAARPASDAFAWSEDDPADVALDDDILLGGLSASEVSSSRRSGPSSGGFALGRERKSTTGKGAATPRRQTTGKRAAILSHQAKSGAFEAFRLDDDDFGSETGGYILGEHDDLFDRRSGPAFVARDDVEEDGYGFGADDDDELSFAGESPHAVPGTSRLGLFLGMVTGVIVIAGVVALLIYLQDPTLMGLLPERETSDAAELVTDDEGPADTDDALALSEGAADDGADATALSAADASADVPSGSEVREEVNTAPANEPRIARAASAEAENPQRVADTGAASQNAEPRAADPPSNGIPAAPDAAQGTPGSENDQVAAAAAQDFGPRVAAARATLLTGEIEAARAAHASIIEESAGATVEGLARLGSDIDEVARLVREVEEGLSSGVCHRADGAAAELRDRFAAGLGTRYYPRLNACRDQLSRRTSGGSSSGSSSSGSSSSGSSSSGSSSSGGSSAGSGSGRTGSGATGRTLPPREM